MSFVLPYIAGRVVTENTTEEELFDSVRDKLHAPESQNLIRSILKRPATDKEIQSVVSDTQNYTRQTFENKKPLKSIATGTNIMLQGVPGSAKTETANAMYSGWSQDKQNNFVRFGYDEYGAIHEIAFWRMLVDTIQDNRTFGPLGFQEAWIQLLAARDFVRDATGVAYDLIRNRTLTERFNALNDTTVSSPNAVASMMEYTRNGFQNHGLSFHAPFEISLDRCLSRERALDLKAEAIGKRGPVMNNFPAFVDVIVGDRGSLTAYFTPTVNGEFTIQPAFQIEEGRIIDKSERVLSAMIDSLEDDLSIPQLKDAPLIEEGTAAFIAKLQNVLKAKKGSFLEPTEPV